MPYDGFVMNKFINQAQFIVGSFLKNIYYKKNTMYFSFSNVDLKISLNPNFSYMTFERRMLSQDMKKHYFVDFLRSRIKNSKILSFEQFGFERTAKLVLEKNDEIGVTHKYEIYTDIMGKHSNIIIVENNKILDAYRRITTRYRNIIPGEKFKLFEGSKINPKTDLDKLFSFAKAFDGKKSEFIFKNIQGFSKITANEVLYRANLEDKKFSCDDLEIIVKTVEELMREFEENKLYIYFENNQPFEISAFKLNHLGMEYKNLDDISKAISFFFEWIEQKSYLFQVKKNLENIVIKKIEKLENILTKIEKEIRKNSDYEKYKKWGELLKAYFYRINDFQKEVELEDWNTGEKINIPLEKDKNPIENANNYFRIYNRKKTKLKGLLERKEYLEKELDYLYQLWYSINEIENTKDVEEIKKELIEYGLIKEKKGKRKKKIEKSLPRKTIYNGFTIYIGKNNRQNDELVKKSSKEDIWLHSHGMPGAHVVIKSEGKDIDMETLKFAAQLAAGYSKGKNSTNVPVDYTKIKHVRKTKDLKPGMVLYDNYKTIYVNPRRLEDVQSCF
ncbi:MAG: NFACT family protein [Thermosipho sp. (in: Bacteria)]|nr:NFACT family protein [Thermosipho sp. (in: thermotogales)]